MILILIILDFLFEWLFIVTSDSSEKLVALSLFSNYLQENVHEFLLLILVLVIQVFHRNASILIKFVKNIILLWGNILI